MAGLTSNIVIVAIAVGYLLGSIPFGLIVTRFAGLGDVRNIGSGNIGATNVLRTGKKGLAAATLLLDGAKGALASVLFLHAALIADDPSAAMLAGFSAIVGHNFPVWLKFKGGKGVATSLGVWLAISWPVGVLACLTWLIMTIVFRYSSLSALIALILAPLYAYWLSGIDLAVMGFAIAMLAVLRHHENIRRLIQGTEPKIGKKSETAS